MISKMQNHLSIAELEERMRPGAYSPQGFLGTTESLELVVQRDEEILKTLEVSHEAIASVLEEILQAVQNERTRLLQFRQRGEKVHEYAKRTEEYRTREANLPDLYHPASIPDFSLENLPSTDIGYLVGDQFQVFIAEYRGLQECPWGCESDPWSNFDFLLLNRELGEYITGPGMIVHLLREHHFFEGVGSPYRVDPTKVIRVLGLVSH